MFLNWHRNRTGFTDVQNAKLISLINGKGLYVVDHNDPSIFIGCTRLRLISCLYKFKNLSYDYPLQRWIGNSYVLFRKCKVELDTEKLIIAALKYLSTEKPITNTLEISVTTVYLRNHYVKFIPPSKGAKSAFTALQKQFTQCGIWQLLFDTARDYIETNLFNQMYGSELSRDCFINFYKNGEECGITS